MSPISSTLLNRLFVLAAVGAAASAFADHRQAVPRVRQDFDSATGRNLLNYPPHRAADILHQKLEITIPDMNRPQFTGIATIRFVPIAGALATLPLHAADLNIRAVTCGDSSRTATFIATPGSDRLELTFAPPVAASQTEEVRIEYEANDPAEGLIWTPESPRWPGRAASLHSQGEPESNRYWFPTHDFPNERMTSEVIASVPEGYLVSSNGRQVSRERTVVPGSNTTFDRFHFVQDKEHAPYLIALAVGKWEVVDVAGVGARVPMPVYAPPGQTERVRAVFGRTPGMVALYERLFDEPYPWDKYAQVVVTNFAWGGMENTSATTLYDGVLLDQAALLDGDEDGLICHELAHQWFGDLLTCKSWEHIWLNEGWATYSEALWEAFKNTSPARSGSPGESPVSGLKADNDAYQYAVWSNFRAAIEKDRTDAPYQPAMASKEYAYPEAVFEKEANPYPKGAAVLHMLRRRLTDPIFWRGVALYIDRQKNTAVETHHFRLAMEEVSAVSLQRFFDQWCYRPGVPRVEVSSAWNAGERTLRLTATQVQNIDGANPAFAFDLPIWIDDGSGSPRTVTLDSERKVASVAVSLSRAPRRIVVDPQMAVLADVRLEQPAAAFVETLRVGPTMAARLEAVQHLRRNPGLPTDRAMEGLATALRDGRTFHGLRIEAAKALGHLANPTGEGEDEVASTEQRPWPEALATLLKAAESGINDARVRKVVTEQLGIAAMGAPREQQRTVTTWLLASWNKDRSYAVRAESLRSLGRLKAIDGMKALEAGLTTESHDDQIRKGAIDGVRWAGFPDAMERATAMTTAGHSPGVRQTAIRAAAKLAKAASAADKDRAFNLLSALINDGNLRVRQAAVEAMLKLEDPRTVPTIEQWVAAARGQSDKQWGAEQLRAKAEKSAVSQSQADQ